MEGKLEGEGLWRLWRLLCALLSVVWYTLLLFPVHCWPSEMGGGKGEVNDEYKLQQVVMALTDVSLTIPFS